jgi:hypothetical protein
MGGLIFVFVVAIILWVVIAVARSSNVQTNGVGSLDQLANTGIRGRALVLAASQVSFGSTINGRRFERRTMTLDVEAPNRAPYVVAGDFLVPRGLIDPIPGASLDVAIDPGNPNNIAVLGPGGFSGPWIRVGPPQPY